MKSLVYWIAAAGAAISGVATALAADPLSLSPAANKRRLQWKTAFRQEAVKRGILLTMIIFVMTLKDRVAEVLALASLLVGLLFNAPIFSSRLSDAC